MKMDREENGILESICKELGIDENMLEVLSKTPLRRLQPILLNVWKKRAQANNPIDILSAYEQKYQFYGTSSISQSRLFAFAQACFSAIPSFFDVVETSPITPIGLNSALSNISQNNSLSTIKDSEVVGDITSQLALECAYRRKKLIKSENVDDAVHLCSSHRVLRMQPFDSSKGYMQHFNLLGLCSGGRGSNGGESFATMWIREHISAIIEMLYALEKFGLSFSDISVSLSDIKFLEQLMKSLCLPRAEINRHSLNDEFDLFRSFCINFPREVESASELNREVFECCGLVDQKAYYSHLEKRIFLPLRQKYPSIRFCFDFTRKAGLGYYKHICFHVFATASGGNRIQVADGGVVDWLEKFLQNKKEAMVTSGIGSELVHKIFESEKES